MIISKFVEVQIRNHAKWWSEYLGKTLTYHDVISVPVEQMPDNSNKKIECSCDECGAYFERGIQLLRRVDKHLCKACSRKDVGQKNVIAQGGVPRPWQRGEKHHSWKGNKREFYLYAQRVHALTRAKHLKNIWSTWENADKIGKCGEEGAYQLDHKVSIAYGFYNHIPETVIASLNNLEIVTWESNRSKGKSNSIDLWDILS